MLENCTYHHLDPPFLTIKSDCGTVDRDLRIELICDEETDSGEGQRPEPINRDYGNGNSSIDGLLQQPQPQQPIYPSHFQTNGAAYIFDRNSSLFYDSAANFYYDPKSDTYYDCTALKYYFYNNINPEQPFIECSGDYGANAGTEGYGSTSVSATTSTNNKPKKISISISSKKKIGSSKSIPSSNKNKHLKLSSSERIRTEPSVDPEASTEPPARKHEIDNMEKWTKFGKELDPGGKSPDHATAVSSSPIPPETSSASSASASTNSSSVAKCLLCKRKFPSLGALKKHEDKSPLHLENLRKAKEKEEEGSTTVYRDRNKERVEIFGDVPGTASNDDYRKGEKTEKGKDFNTNMKEPSPSLSAKDELVLVSDSNIGARMLKKMTKNGGGMKQSSMLGDLRKDFDKIDDIAARR